MLRLLGIPASRLPGNVFDEMRRMSPADGEYIYIFCTIVILEFNGKRRLIKQLIKVKADELLAD